MNGSLQMIAIHERKGSFSDRWVDYCVENKIPYKLVDCHGTDVIQELEGCKALLWNWSQTYAEDLISAYGLVRSAEALGLVVFPDSSTCWHFDNKLYQKYIFEALDLPHMKSDVFYSKRRAYQWADGATYPKVFKLLGGAGSKNVFLVKDRAEARSVIRRMFGRGFPAVSRWQPLSERLWRFKRDRDLSSLLGVAKGIYRSVFKNPLLKALPNQKGYAYFQEFAPENDSDIRVVVIGGVAFAVKRMVRDGDFRASGSGRIVYDKAAIPLICVEVAFKAAERLKAQSLAIDFVMFGAEARIVEVSYGFASKAYIACPGYWRRDLSWVEERFYPEDFMLQDVLKRIGIKESQGENGISR